jgi:hypothetical protein
MDIERLKHLASLKDITYSDLLFSEGERRGDPLLTILGKALRLNASNTSEFSRIIFEHREVISRLSEPDMGLLLDVLSTVPYQYKLFPHRSEILIELFNSYRDISPFHNLFRMCNYFILHKDILVKSIHSFSSSLPDPQRELYYSFSFPAKTNIYEKLDLLKPHGIIKRLNICTNQLLDFPSNDLLKNVEDMELFDTNVAAGLEMAEKFQFLTSLKNLRISNGSRFRGKLPPLKTLELTHFTKSGAFPHPIIADKVVFLSPLYVSKWATKLSDKLVPLLDVLTSQYSQVKEIHLKFVGLTEKREDMVPFIIQRGERLEWVIERIKKLANPF